LLPRIWVWAGIRVGEGRERKRGERKGEERGRSREGGERREEGGRREGLTFLRVEASNIGVMILHIIVKIPGVFTKYSFLKVSG
jgi:hypothetical protein